MLKKMEIVKGESVSDLRKSSEPQDQIVSQDNKKELHHILTMKWEKKKPWQEERQWESPSAANDVSKTLADLISNKKTIDLDDAEWVKEWIALQKQGDIQAARERYSEAQGWIDNPCFINNSIEETIGYVKEMIEVFSSVSEEETGLMLQTLIGSLQRELQELES